MCSIWTWGFRFVHSVRFVFTICLQGRSWLPVIVVVPRIYCVPESSITSLAFTRHFTTFVIISFHFFPEYFIPTQRLVSGGYYQFIIIDNAACHIIRMTPLFYIPAIISLSPCFVAGLVAGYPGAVKLISAVCEV